MGSSNTRYVVNFGTQNLSSLIRARSVIRGIETQSYISFNSASRSLSNLEKTSIRSSNQITRSFDAINRAMRKIGMGGGRGSMMSFGGFGLATLGIGGLIGSVNLLHRAFIQTNTSMQSSRIMIEELLGSANTATPFINKMKDLSASFGQDLNETMTASRGLMQVMKQVNTPQPVHLEKMLKMVMAVNAMDLENRGLGYTSFSFKEAFQGMGRGDFRSLRNRLEINLGKPMETAITKAIQKGDLDKAINLFDEGLKKIGINADRLLRRLSAEGFLQNINRMSSYILRTFQTIGEPLFTALTKPFAKFNSYLAVAFAEGGGAIPYLTKLGEGIRDSFKPAIDMIDNFGQDVMTNIKGNPNDNVITKFVDASRGSLRALFSMLGIVKSFMMGLFGSKSTDNNMKQLSDIFSNIANFGDQASLTMDSLSGKANELGLSFGNMAKEGVKSFKIIADSISKSPIPNAMYQAPKTAIDATTVGMSGLNSLGAIGAGGALGLGLGALLFLKNPIKGAKFLASKLGKGKGATALGGVSDDVAGAVFGRGNPNLANALEKSKLGMFSKSPKNLNAEAGRLLNREGLRDLPKTKIKLDPSKTKSDITDHLIRDIETNKWVARGFHLKVWDKYSKSSSALSDPSKLVPSITPKSMSFMSKLGLGAIGGLGLGTIAGSYGSTWDKLGLGVGVLGQSVAIVSKSVGGLGLATAFALKDIYDGVYEFRKMKQEQRKAKDSWKTASNSAINLESYKRARSLTEGFAGGVGIGELNRQMKIGMHGLPVNKDNYEWFLKYGTDEKGRKAFKGVHSAFEAGLISPTDLKQMSPQMYDIFANKTQEMVHKGEIILNSKNIFTKEVEQEIVDGIMKRLADQKEKNKPQTAVDDGLSMISNIKGSFFGN